ncbi:hypothetical protein ILUMI_22604 [Ignelater luminosus]|uniref:MYND-type domain-containing protein n=1 Tax=Ignelater luminosus TaxID=2038154 RepID=A0A8K0CGR2_IGNLU|nr:hypothetical protein ILUMI_22604 [Ignelater luminosus]
MDSVLLSTEIDLYVNTMQTQKMINVGNKHWLEWHQRLQKLNQQAVIEASQVKEEYVKEILIAFGKIPILVHEAILINLWKHKILPILLRMEPSPSSTFIAYSILYHEAVCVALLELVMYHGSASEALGDAAVDLLDYAYGTASQLLILECGEVEINEKAQIELMRQRDGLCFEIGTRSLTILRYLADYLDRLPLSVTARMFSVNDVPVLLTQILIKKPWIRKGKQYSGGHWVPWDGEALVTTEAQVWLALRQLLLDPACPVHYDITDSRRSQLLKLQPLMSPVLLDQVSPLIELQQWLYRLAVTDQQAAPHRPILLEVVLEIKNKILEECGEKWKKIAREQLPNVFTKDRQQLLETAQSLSEAYNTELLEKFEDAQKPASNNCSKCGKSAIQRCSQCKNQWYCSRNCQVMDWPKHKAQCIKDT